MKYTYGMTAAALAITAATAFAGGAQASSIQFSIIESRFFDPVGGNVRFIDTGFTDPAEIRWGQNALALASTSGYEFESVTTPLDAPIDTVFGLGSFTHFNFPINSGTSITGVSFEVRGGLTFIADDSTETAIGERTFAFDILHNETPNVAAQCPGDTPPCDDFVSISTALGTDTFHVGDASYTLNILGFATSIANAEAGIFNSVFSSPEGGSNLRILAAEFSQDVPTIPLPAAGWLLLAGIGGLGALRRFRKT